ncbi:hypothetical protein GLX30_02665 [Streptomyces sp. Tu 2975]|uniref:hypothetical protein n=1 Tax=Streptomyces sp. Tu 2975 TaxID=2676871 RepID=UPI0013598B8D|nr:hypothetical protein [Streptomyces sp. Tu 2975]QIP83160.1 hypothetical protein GLX30_02665 [Streptomyces sp. Tu 2975]
MGVAQETPTNAPPDTPKGWSADGSMTNRPASSVPTILIVDDQATTSAPVPRGAGGPGSGIGHRLVRPRGALKALLDHDDFAVESDETR